MINGIAAGDAIRNAELIEGFTYRMRDDVVDALRRRIHRGNRWKNHRADFGKLRERAKMP